MKYFKGKGYSKEFVANLASVIKKLEDNPQIEVINSVDVICSSCPHNINDKCMKKSDSDEKVRKKDNKIMKILDLRLDQEIMANDAKKLVDLNLDKLRKTCKDCEWEKYCI